ncbi:hypothetical protein NC652_010274 [Populus alba x Populus x berolinensis]|nr:hypothetical protein NC652_010274 [Populus alba x Populus x berolinensis]
MFYEMLDGKRDQVFVLSQTGDELQIDQRKMEKAFALCCKLENCIQVWRKQHMVELLDGWSKKLGFTKTKKRGLMKSILRASGNGMHSTIITVSFNVVDGYTTFKSATVAADGDGFIAQDIWFQNTARPQKHQAVALRIGADQSVINRCRIDAYQDTLFAHSLRRFYRDCYITGTVD